ncbi:dipeptide/oligopeptide/nickel ABC transporter ATP-binding protein [Actinomycetes bacterium]|nr:dipeptide transport ATP-binding protein DppD [Actinomycetota bacterium]GDX21550.1 dipeptide/oligopeptide/nickel ABC transporter ATP-binding protein [Actinomycetes bacterium]
MTQILSVNNLHVTFPTDDGLVRAVDGVSLTLNEGETLAIVGESGSGKTVTGLSVMGLHKKGSAQLSGSIRLKDGDREVEIVTSSDEEIRSMRGRAVAMIFQDPMSSLHPYYRIGNQLAEGYLVHNPGEKKQARIRAIEMLDLVGIAEPAQRADEFPHQFSGGMRQRVMIAMALMNSPRVLIADEPTTALDVTVQAQILNLLKSIQKEFNMGILLITHDLGVVAQVADKVSVMYGGRIVEYGSADDIFYKPKAPYTLGLLKSVPRISAHGSERLKAIPGQPPSLINLPIGCAFSPRCQFASHAAGDICSTTRPELLGNSPTHLSRCHIAESNRDRLFIEEIKQVRA